MEYDRYVKYKNICFLLMPFFDHYLKNYDIN